MHTKDILLPSYSSSQVPEWSEKIIAWSNAIRGVAILEVLNVCRTEENIATKYKITRNTLQQLIIIRFRLDYSAVFLCC